jgi:alpha-D-ribose 1-methylphosphonate 5-triphosphate synthase subunit PhnL
VSAPALDVRGVDKTFTLHTQGGVQLPVLRGVSLAVNPGECVVLGDPSGAGKSTLLRSVYGNYRPQAGQILVRHGQAVVDMVTAEPRQVLALRRRTLGHASQFLRVIPRVPALDLVAEPLRALEVPWRQALDRAQALLERLGIPPRLWSLSPVTFSGGEQQRVNLARVLVVGYPILLLDEPTASLDAGSRAVVVELIREARAGGAAILAIAHDPDVRQAVATRIAHVAAAPAAPVGGRT